MGQLRMSVPLLATIWMKLCVVMTLTAINAWTSTSTSGSMAVIVTPTSGIMARNCGSGLSGGTRTASQTAVSTAARLKERSGAMNSEDSSKGRSNSNSSNSNSSNSNNSSSSNSSSNSNNSNSSNREGDLKTLLCQI